MKKILKGIGLIITSILLIFTSLSNLKAAEATISVSSSTSKVVVGNSFNVTIKISGSNLGAWEWTVSYDKNKLKLVSGEETVVDTYENSKTNTYKFKAIGTGSSKISVKSVGVLSMSEKKMSYTINTKTISVITQKELEASYSKNNYLKSLSVDGFNLDPVFNKDKTEYRLEVPSSTEQINIKATTEDKEADVSGTGLKAVTEGENKFNILVTAENGSTKTYILTVNVKDPNPINVSVNNEPFTLIKRESSLDIPEGYEKVKVKISDEEIPALYNELNDFTLVGLKDKDGNTDLYLYNEKNNSYRKYNESIMNDVKLFPLDMDKSFETEKSLAMNILSIINKKFNTDDYIPTKVKINGIEFDALKQTNNSEFAIIHARDLLTGKDNYYKYDSKINTVIRFDENELNIIASKLNDYKNIILILGIETILIIVVLISILTKQVVTNKKRNKKIEELLKKKEEEQKEENEPKKKKKKMSDDEEK